MYQLRGSMMLAFGIIPPQSHFGSQLPRHSTTNTRLPQSKKEEVFVYQKRGSSFNPMFVIIFSLGYHLSAWQQSN